MIAASLGMYEAAGFTHPITYTYQVMTPWGQGQQSLTVNVPYLANDPDATEKLGGMLWAALVAPATSVLCRVATVIVEYHRTGAAVVHAETPGIFGARAAPPSPRDRTPALQLHSGRLDRFSARTFPVIGAPASWSDGGLCTDEGLRQLEDMAQRIMIAGAAPSPFLTYEHLLLYRGKDTGERGVPGPMGFRYLNYVRVMHHTMQAPLPSFVL